MSKADWARQQLQELQQEYHDFNPPIVPVLSWPTAVEFSKQVSKGLPCVYKAGLSQSADNDALAFKALSWTQDYLCSAVTEKVEIAVTPTGRADAIVAIPSSIDGVETNEKVFLQPASMELTLTELFSRLSPIRSESENDGLIYYLQSQNSNLTSTPLSALMRELPTNFSFAEEVQGEPDARNIWIGTGRSVTSVHRDPYENLYLVLKGSKTFSLWPPVDEVAMPTKVVRTGKYSLGETTGSFTIRLDESLEHIPWIDLDATNPNELAQMHAKGARLRIVTVKEGEMLYLPSGWFHSVSQQCGQWDNGSKAPCIAVNYWYDMEYEGERYSMRQMLSRLVTIACGDNDAP